MASKLSSPSGRLGVGRAARRNARTRGVWLCQKISLQKLFRDAREVSSASGDYASISNLLGHGLYAQLSFEKTWCPVGGSSKRGYRVCLKFVASLFAGNLQSACVFLSIVNGATATQLSFGRDAHRAHSLRGLTFIHVLGRGISTAVLVDASTMRRVFLLARARDKSRLRHTFGKPLERETQLNQAVWCIVWPHPTATEGNRIVKEQTLCERVAHTHRPTAELPESMGYLS